MKQCEPTTPSARYLSVLVNGATEAKLDPAYIEKLKQTETYKPSAETLEKRKAAYKDRA